MLLHSYTFYIIIIIMTYHCNEAEYMRKVIPLILLVIAICITLLIFVFGADGIVSLLPGFDDPQNMRLEVYARIAIILLGIIFVVFLLEKLNVINEFKNTHYTVNTINMKLSDLLTEVRYI